MQQLIKKLNSAKKAKGYTLKQLSAASGLTLGTVNKIMSGELQKIKPDKLSKLAEALDVTEEYLLADETQTVQAMPNSYLGLVKNRK